MIAITAATGRLGQAVINEFRRRGLQAGVRLTARSPEKLESLRQEGFEPARADYDDPASMEAAFTGVDTLLLISGAGPNDVRIANHRAAVDAAKKAGVRRIVYTSFVNPTPASKFVWVLPHVDTEAYLKASGLTYVLLRDNQYAANIDNFVSKAAETGVFAIPGASGKVAYVTHEDVAAAIVEVLTGTAEDNATYELTGPQALDAAAIAAELTDILGRPVTAAEAASEDVAAAFRAAGFPEFVVEGLISMYAASGAGEYAAVTKDVAKLTGHPATPLREHLKQVLA